jgi:hypothetical protein
MSAFTITRNNGFYTYENGSQQVYIRSAAALTMQSSLGDLFFFDSLTLDYTDCVDPSGATDAQDLMKKIRDLTD